MQILVVGASHHSTPLALREKLAFSKEQLLPTLQQILEALPEVESVLLSTCNRTELYLAASTEKEVFTEGWVLDFFASQSGIDLPTLEKHLFRHADRQAIEHLFRVTSSLESMVLGETQIVSQVRSAYDTACQLQPQLPILHSVFQKATNVAKTIAGETDINRHRISVASVAISGFASDIFETLQDKRILVIGAGEIAIETLVYLSDFGVGQIHVVNRSLENGTNLAKQFAGTAHPWQDLHKQIQLADLVVSATGAHQFIVSLDEFQEIHYIRRQRPLLILDLAIPRDFDPAIDQMTNVYLYSVDDLKAQCERNHRLRENELPKAEAIVQRQVDQFLHQWNMRFSAPAIRQLRDRTDEIKAEELNRLFRKLQDLSPETKREIEISFDRLVNKMLHRPMESLRDEAKKGSPHKLVESLKRLFQLSD